MKRLFLSFVALALLAGSIAACGQKGPLYLPDDEKPRKNTAKTATVSERAPMDTFSYRDGELFAEGVALSRIAERFGTPTYVYSRAHIEAQYRAYADALAGMPHLVCFAVKANSNLGVLNVLARLGAGFDIVSRGELGVSGRRRRSGQRWCSPASARPATTCAAPWKSACTASTSSPAKSWSACNG